MVAIKYWNTIRECEHPKSLPFSTSSKKYHWKVTTPNYRTRVTRQICLQMMMMNEDDEAVTSLSEIFEKYLMANVIKR